MGKEDIEIGNYVFARELNFDGKTKKFTIHNKSSGSTLGRVKWYPQWRQYCYFTERQQVLSKGCMNSINNFIEQLEGERQ